MAKGCVWKVVLPSLILFVVTSKATGESLKLLKSEEETGRPLDLLNDSVPLQDNKPVVDDLGNATMEKGSKDGNHKSLTAVVTHEQVDKTFGKSLQTKRVKKILPPYPHSSSSDTKNYTADPVSEVELSSALTTIAITSNEKSLNKIAQLEARNISVNLQEDDEKGGIIPESDYKTSFIYENTTKISEQENRAGGADGGGGEAHHKREDENEGDKPQSAEAANLTHLLEKITTRGEKDNGAFGKRNDEKIEIQREILLNNNNKSEEDETISKTAMTTTTTMTTTMKTKTTTMLEKIITPPRISAAANEVNNNVSTTEASSSGPSSDLTKEVDSPPDLLSSKTTTTALEGDIKGIRLVPKENLDIFQLTTERTIWDLIQQREEILQEEQADEEPIVLPYQMRNEATKKTPFENFEAESAEVEYENENYRHGFSNIEKHELPYSYGLPWLEAAAVAAAAAAKEIEPRKEVEHIKINDFPNIIPINKNHFEAMNNNEEMRIPQDISKLLQLSKLSETERGLGGVTLSILETGGGGGAAGDGGDVSRDGRRSKWYLLLLTGNSTIIKLRRKDFTKYLKLNLAARLSVEYDDVTVNKVILAPPKVLVNVSVYATSDDIAEESQFDLRDKEPEGKGDTPLSRLAETNATLLELSGEEYHVVRFMSLQQPAPEALAQKNIPSYVSVTSRHDDIEFIIYTFLGSACACAVILTLFLGLSKYYKKLGECDWPWNRPKIAVWTEAWGEDGGGNDEMAGLSPAVIYSGGFPQVRGSWMTLGVPQNQKPVLKGSLLQRYPGIELGVAAPQHETAAAVTASPRHNKVRMYNCGANRIVFPRPLDVRISSTNAN